MVMTLTAARAQAGSAGLAGETKRHTRRNFTPYMFLAPFLILFVAFFLAPIFYALYLSLFVNRLIGGTTFVGAANYLQVLHDSAFWSGFERVMIYAVIEVPLTIILALTLALILDSGRVRMVAGLQLVFFVPFAIPTVVAALLWGYMYGPNFGVLTQLSRDIGIGNPGFLSPGGILPSIMNIAIWATAGANMVIIYAALKSIPLELYEAARLDGASDWSIVRHIKIPLLRSTVLFTTVLAVIVALQLFNEPEILQPNAPGSISASFTPNVYSYGLVSHAQYNYGAAVSFVLAAGIIIITGTVLAVSRKVGSQ
jgi:multiple sugar transport system permease protein